jgi:hypothetical protein
MPRRVPPPVTLSRVGRLILIGQVAGAFFQFLNYVYLLALILFACIFWVTSVYPLISPTLGGGRPIPIQLILPEESIPTTPEFADWNSREDNAKAPPSSATKTAVAVPVTLYFHTEHELYVRKGSGPIVSISDHAIEAILYPGTQLAMPQRK